MSFHPSKRSSTSFTSDAGHEVTAYSEAIELDGALDPLFAAIDSRRGAIFSSGFDYPGRHSRWDIGFVDPALELVAKGRTFAISALNEQGSALLPLLASALEPLDALSTFRQETKQGHGSLFGELKAPDSFFSEEERSRQPSLFSVLRAFRDCFASQHESASHFGLYGAFGYDLVAQFEDIKLRLPRDPEQEDCHLYFPLELIVVDRQQQLASKLTYSVATPAGNTDQLSTGGEHFTPSKASGSEEIVSDHRTGEFAEKVDHIIEGTKRGDYFEVVLSQAFSTTFTGKPTELFMQLAEINPSPYMFLLNFGTQQLIGSSPEIYVRVTGRRYETCPIAGTVSRGETALEDADQVRQLIGSNKDESELTMCTDVDRNDMARVCTPGSVRILGRRQLEFYSHLIHTVDHVEGHLKDEYDSLDAFQTHMWACTVTGAPKPAALQAIEDFENTPRGWYSGAIGMLCFNGNINTGITLRSATLRNGRAELRAGATLLYGSNPEKEELETRTKAGAFLAALASTKDKSLSAKVRSAIPRARGRSRRVLLVDCRDSFVHNLAAYLRQIGAEVTTVRPGFPENVLGQVDPDLVFLSPGPGTPSDFDLLPFIEMLLAAERPIFGVCLGHQAIGQYFGAHLEQLPEPEHGKAAVVVHNSSPLFRDVDSEFEAGRYHSLYLQAASMPECLEITASTTRIAVGGTPEVIPMAIEHRTLPLAGVQFHPESLMTLKQHAGHSILRNALENLSRR